MEPTKSRECIFDLGFVTVTDQATLISCEHYSGGLQLWPPRPTTTQRHKDFPLRSQHWVYFLKRSGKHTHTLHLSALPTYTDTHTTVHRLHVLRRLEGLKGWGRPDDVICSAARAAEVWSLTTGQIRRTGTLSHLERSSRWCRMEEEVFEYPQAPVATPESSGHFRFADTRQIFSLISISIF